MALTSYKGSQTNLVGLSPILSVGIFVGILVAIVCIGIGTIATLKLRAHKQQQKYQHQSQKYARPGNLQIKDKITLPLSHADDMYDEKNPDVVPYNEGKRSVSPLHSIVIDRNGDGLLGNQFVTFVTFKYYGWTTITTEIE